MTGTRFEHFHDDTPILFSPVGDPATVWLDLPRIPEHMPPEFMLHADFEIRPAVAKYSIAFLAQLQDPDELSGRSILQDEGSASHGTPIDLDQPNSVFFGVA
jgi:hypothetical protein